MYRMRDLVDSGATIAFGSDWPVSSSDPILGIATAVSRLTADAQPEGGWVAEQALTAAEALESYSTAPIFQLTGRNITPLGVGEPCDFVLLDRNPLEENTLKLREITVLETYKAAVRIG
jgi:predicted amidohydrolase YtcJ